MIWQVAPNFVAQFRAALNDTLWLARAAELLPWPDLTRTTLAKLRFNAIARWLPDDEAATLR